jgi:voltage-gated potassium channel
VVSAAVLGLCGVGLWWLEPGTPARGGGLWLAFTTAATVGYGDSVTSLPASNNFSVFV